MSPTTKPPVIRAGQQKPYAKATRLQMAVRIEAASLLMDFRFHRTRIHRIFRERYGMEWRQTDRYMARARAEKHAGEKAFDLAFDHFLTDFLRK